MKLAIKEYWENLKLEYEATYNASIFSDYDVLKKYAERFRTYLITLMCEYSNDVDVVCTLATVEQVLRHEENSIQLLEEFLRKYIDELSDTDKVKGDEELSKHVDHTIYVPRANKFIAPILAVVPLQLLAYYAAITRGADVDKPRNLAKSVTVE